MAASAVPPTETTENTTEKTTKNTTKKARETHKKPEPHGQLGHREPNGPRGAAGSGQAAPIGGFQSGPGGAASEATGRTAPVGPIWPWVTQIAPQANIPIPTIWVVHLPQNSTIGVDPRPFLCGVFTLGLLPESFFEGAFSQCVFLERGGSFAHSF